VLGKHADRPQPDHRVVADRRPAAHDVPDELPVPDGDERQRRDGVAGVRQLLDEPHLDRRLGRVVRRAEGFRVDPAHGLAVARRVPSNEHGPS
jgi:hypothetical protein